MMEELWSQYYKRAVALYESGNLVSALKIAQFSLKCAEKSYGKESKEFFQSLYLLKNIYKKLNQLNNVLDTLAQVRILAKKLYGNNSKILSEIESEMQEIFKKVNRNNNIREKHIEKLKVKNEVQEIKAKGSEVSPTLLGIIIGGVIVILILLFGLSHILEDWAGKSNGESQEITTVAPVGTRIGCASESQSCYARCQYSMDPLCLSDCARNYENCVTLCEIERERCMEWCIRTSRLQPFDTCASRCAQQYLQCIK